MARWRLRLGGAAVALALLGGCGGEPSPTPSATPTPTSPAPSTAAPTTPSPSATTATPGPSTPAPSPSSNTPAPTPTASPAGCTVPDRLRGQDLERLPVSDKVVALTFDGGAGAQGATSILDTLAEAGVPATFFLTGRFARTFPDVTARMGAEHVVGNHSDSHPDLTTLGEAEIRAEIRTAEGSIRRLAGQDPRRFFRFPFGARDERTIRVVNDLCYVPFRWTVDTLGWKGTSDGQSVRTVVDRVLAAATPGEIVLMHVGAHPTDGSTLDADALPTVIRRLRGEGYSFVPLSRVMSAAP